MVLNRTCSPQDPIPPQLEQQESVPSDWKASYISNKYNKRNWFGSAQTLCQIIVPVVLVGRVMTVHHPWLTPKPPLHGTEPPLSTFLTCIHNEWLMLFYIFNIIPGF